MDIDFRKDQLTGMKILIVDDEPNNLDIMGHFLRSGGLNISIATSGNQALSIVSKNKPDLILLDIVMPDIEGFEVCEILKKDVATENIPVIFITARSEIESIIKGYQVGGTDYITKPFQEQEVLYRIHTRLNLIKKQKEIIKQEKLYRTILEKVPELIFQLDPEKKIIYANPAFIRLGYEPEELLGKPFIDLIKSDNKNEIIKENATDKIGPFAPNEIEVLL
ncbi:MAG: response regulator [Nitrospina sp.]|jgi:DNA-binding response OmpR family regulator|nr:response regulator [Nitrospina sp.]